MSGQNISRKEGWRDWVDAAPWPRPERMNAKQLADLGEGAKFEYDEARKDWHANFGILRTPQLASIYEELDLIVDSNRQSPDRVRGAAVIDANPGLGKTTIAHAFARDFDREQRRRFGDLTDEGQERVPVFRVCLTSRTTMRTLSRMICEFYGHPNTYRATAAQLVSQAVDCVVSCDTRLGFIDELHFMNMHHRDGLEVSNHLKWLSNELAITLVYAGVGLGDRGLFTEGLREKDRAKAQTARRLTRLHLPPFTIADDQGRTDWENLLKATERQLVLARHRPGALTGIADYLFARTTGHIGSYMTLIVRGCKLAIDRGTERIDIDLLDSIRIDEAAETHRDELQAQFAAGRLTSTPLGKPRMRK